jgi:hypothetical protein
VALIVALVVLVIIGLTSAAVMRGSLSTDLIANNARTQTLAMQAAQIAMRYCEDEAMKDDPAIDVLEAAVDDDHAEWRNYASWSAEGKVNTIPKEYFESEFGTYSLGDKQLPQCIVQKKTISGKEARVVTVRGLSPDYTVNEKSGFTESGSVVWLQSTLHLTT